MSTTKYARDQTLRLDAEEAGVLARAVMASIERWSELRIRPPGNRVDQELRTLRSLLERLSD